jgi:hypothetical protein
MPKKHRRQKRMLADFGNLLANAGAYVWSITLAQMIEATAGTLKADCRHIHHCRKAEHRATPMPVRA